MWQSAGKYVPTVEQLKLLRHHRNGLLCRVETNGGLRANQTFYWRESNKAVREWTQPFNEAGIQTYA